MASYRKNCRQDMAENLNNRVTRRWLTSGVKLPERTRRAQAFQIVLPQLIRVTAEVFGEDSETAAEFNRFFLGDKFRKDLGIK